MRVHATLEHFYMDWSVRFARAGDEQYPNTLPRLRRASLVHWLEVKMTVLMTLIKDDDTGL